MNPVAPPHDAARQNARIVQTLIEELTAFPTVNQDDAASRSLTIPRQSLLHDWMELYWQSLERSEFLDWASRFDIDLDTFRLEGDTLHASVTHDGVTSARVFMLEDESGWWQVAPPILAVARKIDPHGRGLPYIGGKSANPLHQFPRHLVLEFHGYPEPENRQQAYVIINELKTRGLASIGSDAHTTSAVVGERAAQLQDLAASANALEQTLAIHAQQKQPYDAVLLGNTQVRLRDGSFLAAAMQKAGTALSTVTRHAAFISAAGEAVPFASCRYAASTQTFFLVGNDRKVSELPETSLVGKVPEKLLTSLNLAAKAVDADISSDGFFRLDQLLNCYDFFIPETLAEAGDLITRLREKTWTRLPYVSEYLQTRAPILRHQQAFADAEDYRHIALRLQELGSHTDNDVSVALQELNRPVPGSSLYKAIEEGWRELRQLRGRPELQRLLTRERLPAHSRLRLTGTGEVSVINPGHNPIDLTAKVASQAALTARVNRLKELAVEAGGALRSDGLASLAQMLEFYAIPRPLTPEEARITGLWTKPAYRLSPNLNNHWALLGRPGHAIKGLSRSKRQKILDTTNAFLEGVTHPLIDHLCEGITDDLEPALQQARADALLGLILITPQAHELGNRLLMALAPASWDEKVLRAVLREQLVLTALILSLDPEAGRQPVKVIGQALDDPFFWGEPMAEVRRFIANQFALHLVKNKTLATHLLLSGLAPVFLVRGIPAWLAYMSSNQWVKLTQVVMYIEQRASGLTRLMPFNELMNLTMQPSIEQLEDIRAQPAATLAQLDWAVARGLIQRDASTRSFDSATRIKVEKAFVEHSQHLFNHLELAFRRPFPTPYTVALADLRKVFPDNLYLEEKCLHRQIAQNAETEKPARYSLVELHIARQLQGALQDWSCTLPLLKLAELSPQFVRLSAVSEQFAPLLESRIRRMAAAQVAMIKELFCQLPLHQRQDLERGALRLFTLHPVPTDFAEPPAGSPWDVPAGTFGIIVSCQSNPHRLYEVMVRDTAVVLRRDVQNTFLPNTSDTLPRQLPFDAQAYQQGLRPRAERSCRGMLKALAIEGAPLADAAGQVVPDTFNSVRVEAIARTAVKQLSAEAERLVARQMQAQTNLEKAAQSHRQWLAFYRALTSPAV